MALCAGNWYRCRNSVWLARFDGHVISSGAFLTKTVIGAAARGTRKVDTAPKPSSSKVLMAFLNSAYAIPRKLRRALCLNAR